jgi:hypothetical protein
LPALNIIVSAVTTSPKTNTEFINMTFMVDSPKFKDLYLEFSDIDLNEVFKNEMLKDAYEKGQLSEYTKIDKTLDDYNLRLIKDDTVIQVQRIRDYFEGLSEYADKLVFELSKKVDLPIHFISLVSPTWQKQINSIEEKTIIYLTDYHTLKKNMKDYVVKYIEDKTCVISTLECEDSFPYRKIEINSEKELVGITNIMTINDYVKMMVMSYQNKYPDTELSKKLGISRKSLWEKRKKLDIEKKK